MLSNQKYPIFGSAVCSAWDKGYRFGFNGKEIDKGSEGMGGGGSSYDYGFRIYNPSLGKFLSVDPLTASYPWNSSYAFAENDVIRCIDLDGLERYIVTENGVTADGKTILIITLQTTSISTHTSGGVQFIYNGVSYNTLNDPILDAYYGNSYFKAGVLYGGDGKRMKGYGTANNGSNDPSIMSNHYSVNEFTDKPGATKKSYTCEKTQFNTHNSAMANDGKSSWTSQIQSFTTPNAININGDILVSITILPSSSEENSFSITDAAGNPISLTPSGSAPSSIVTGSTPMVATPQTYTFCLPKGSNYNINVNASVTLGDAYQVDIQYTYNENITTTKRVECKPPDLESVNCTP
jgi:RHS repeat-associated protein